MSMNIDFIVKLGGSAVTDKNNVETEKPEAIQKAVKLLGVCHSKNLKFVVVHGGGSFGHHYAKEYAVQGGYTNKDKDQARVKLGFAITRASVLKLNNMLLKALTDENIPAVGVASCGLTWTTKEGDLKSAVMDHVLDLLEEGFVPVLHGDCILDKNQGCRILSGDAIINYLCHRVKPQRVVFLSDVGGVYDKPPQEEDAKLLPQISISEGAISPYIMTDTSEHDVTGGIRFKMDCAVDIVMNSEGKVPVYICGVMSKAAENICLHGEFQGEPGTLIHHAGKTKEEDVFSWCD